MGSTERNFIYLPKLGVEILAGMTLMFDDIHVDTLWASVSHAVSLTPVLLGTGSVQASSSSYCPHKAGKVSRDAPWCRKKSSPTAARRNRALSPLVPSIDGIQPYD
jgi:hypothetical protein